MRAKRAWLIAAGVLLVLVVTAAVVVINSARGPVTVNGTPSGVSAVWHPIGGAPIDERWDPVAFADGDRVVLFGGWMGEAYQLDGAVYYADEDRWETLPNAQLEPRSGADVRLADGRLLVYGGEKATEEGWLIGGEIEAIDGELVQTGALRLDGAVFDLATGTWLPIPEPPISRREDNAIAWDGQRLFVWGGSESADSFDSGPGKVLYDGAAWDRATGVWTPLAPGSDVPLKAGDGGPTSLPDNTGDEPPWTGRQIGPGAILSELFTDGPTVSVQLTDGTWLSAPVPHDAARHPAAARLDDGTVFIWDGERGEGWLLVVTEEGE